MVPVTDSRYRALRMTAVRPRRTRVRRALLILAAVTVTSLGLDRARPGAYGVPRPRSHRGGAAHAAGPNRRLPPGRRGPEPGKRDPRDAGPRAAALGDARRWPPSTCGPVSGPDSRRAPATRHALQKRLDQLRERYGVPGISVTMLFPDGSSWVGVSGAANVEAKAPVTTSTSFAIASVSKTFTARPRAGARAGRDGRPGRAGADVPARAEGQCQGSRSASCSTTPAACATTSSIPPSTGSC